MQTRAWGFVAVAAAIIVGSVTVAPAVASATTPPDGPPPVVTSVDNNGAFPEITVDWGAHIDAPVGVIESVDGYLFVVPSDSSTYAWDAWRDMVGPVSYRVVACYAECNVSDIAQGRATMVTGPWLRPDVGDVLARPGPSLWVWYSGANRFYLGWDMSENPGAAAVRVFRNGVPIGAVPPDTTWYYDPGPFTSTVVYSATACYSDCNVPSTQPVTFAQETSTGPEQTFHAASSPVATWMYVDCTPTGGSGMAQPVLKVNMKTTCTPHVNSKEFALAPTGSVEFRSDDDPSLPPTSCTLQEGVCDVELLPGRGSAGTRTITFSYRGDDMHEGTSVVRSWGVARRSSATAISCPPKAGVGEPTACAVTVSDSDAAGTPLTPMGLVTVETDAPGTSPAVCRLDGFGTCRVSLTYAHRSDTSANVVATFYPDGGDDGDHIGSTSPAVQVSIVKAATKLVAQPAIASVVSPTTVSLELSARLTDAVTGHPIAGARIRFRSNGNPLCNAVTDATGTATCSSQLPVAGAALGYNAFYDGDSDHHASSTSADGVRL